MSPLREEISVAVPEIGPAFAKSLREGGVQRALVVCGFEGLDEMSCAGSTHAWELHEDGSVSEHVLTPEYFGLPVHALSKVVGGLPHETAETFEILLNSGSQIPENLIPVLDFVLMNASALLIVASVAKDYVEGTELARQSVYSGRAWDALGTFRDVGRKAKSSLNAVA
ncbi:hypothetical protein H1R20_g11026, partial [Candolleomyces eurysporus]